MLTKDKFLEALDRNIMIFDADAEPSVFTKRLIYLMKVVVRRQYGLETNKRGKLVDLYIPDMKLFNNWTIDYLEGVTDDLDNSSKIVIFGVNIIKDKRLNNDGELSEVFRISSGTLATNDNFLVVGIDEDNNGWLGSF